MGSRPKIPAKTKRRVLLESGYRCSIPTCRFPVTENAHIISWSETKDHSYQNLITLCPNCHVLYDSGKIPTEALIAYKKKLFFLNDIYTRFELDVLDYLKTHKRAMIFGELIIKRLLDEEIVFKEDYIMTQGFGDGEEILGIFSVLLTDKGIKLLEDWNRVDATLTFDNL